MLPTNSNANAHNFVVNSTPAPLADNINEITVEQLHDVIDTATTETDNVDNSINSESDRYYCTHNSIVEIQNSNNNNSTTRMLIDSGASHFHLLHTMAQLSLLYVGRWRYYITNIGTWYHPGKHVKGATHHNAKLSVCPHPIFLLTRHEGFLITTSSCNQYSQWTNYNHVPVILHTYG